MSVDWKRQCQQSICSGASIVSSIAPTDFFGALLSIHMPTNSLWKVAEESPNVCDPASCGGDKDEANSWLLLGENQQMEDRFLCVSPPLSDFQINKYTLTKYPY